MTATLISLILLLASCHPKVELITVGEALIIQQLENGNYEVTQGFIDRTWKALNENEQLKRELADCRGIE